MESGQNVVVIISGGGDPAGNNYSQYLQARLMNRYWREASGTDQTTYFGSGLTPDSSQSISPDVIKKDNPEADATFIRGEIPGNQAATYENITGFLRNLNLRKWNLGDTFTLFVADHGNQNYYDPTDIEVTEEGSRDAFRNNCITLWSPGLTLYPERACLGVMELKDLLQKNVPGFVPVRHIMTQCFSGGFHALGYRLDEKGIPHREGNICGFTAITEDTTAAGCTSFVQIDTYDGYERRIAEAITGISVITGEVIDKPIPHLASAHDEALLLDHTKDVPLRSSEAYVLDYLAAKKKLVRKNGDSEPLKAPLEDLDLNLIWTKLIIDKKGPDSLDPDLKRDMERRLSVIEKLRKQLMHWHKGHRFNLASADLNEISSQRSAARIMMSSLKKAEEELEEKLKKLRGPLFAAYLLALKERTDAEGKELFEFEILANLSQTSGEGTLYARLQQEDPTLKKYERYLASQNNYGKAGLAWAETKPEKYKPETLEEIRDLMTKTISISNEQGELSTFEGELRRLETQMKVAAGIVWIAEEKDQVTLADLKAFIQCESGAEAVR